MKTFNQFKEAKLSAAERRALPNKDFALPGKGEGPKGKQAGSYPIPDKSHARAALSMVAQHGTPEEKAKVRAKVKAKFPDIGEEVTPSAPDSGMESKEKRQQQIKKMVLLKKLQAVRAGDKNIFTHYEPKGEQIDEVKVTRVGDAQQKAMQDAVLSRKENLKKKQAAAKAKGKQRVTSTTKQYDADGDGYVRTIDAGYEPEGEMVEGKIADALKQVVTDMKAADRKAGLLPGGKDVVDLDVERERRRKKKVDEGKLTSVKATTYGMPHKEREELINKERKRLGVKPKPEKRIDEKLNYDPMDDPTFDPHEAEKKRGVSGKNNPKGGKKLKKIVKEDSADKAFKTVVSALRKKHGESGVLTKDSPKPKPPSDAEKAKAAAERKKRQEADKKAYDDRARKAGFKSTQDYTDTMARYGGERNYKAGRGLGT